jgi:uncharacterized caspase-like protein
VKHIRLAILLLCGIAGIFTASGIYASTQKSLNDSLKALELFQLGEQAYLKQNYQQALQWYQKAIEFHDADGSVTTSREVIVKSVNYGRMAKQVSTENIEQQDYFPNKRISEIQLLLAEQQRRSKPPVLNLQWMTLRDPTRDNILDGGETGAIVIKIENQGQSAAFDVQLEVSSDNASNLTFNKKITIGNINAGDSHIANIEVAADRKVTDNNYKFLIKALEKGGFDSNDLEVLLQTKPHQPANIVLSELDIQDLNDNKLIEATESVLVTGLVTNQGAGVSNDVTASIDLGDNIYLVPGSKKELHIGQLYPGESKPVEYTFITNRRFSHQQKLPVSISVNDGKTTAPIVQALDLTMHMPQNKVSINVQPKSNTKSGNTSSSSVDVDINIPTGIKKNKDAVAVIIGNKNYQISGLPPVEYSLNDARTMRKYLVKTLGFSDHNIIHIENATAARFTETFGNSENFAGKLYNYVNPGKSDVFIYYSGHGAPDLQNKGSYFVPVDVDPNYIATSGYSLDLFYKNISKIPAKSITIVLDTCFSGNSDGGFLLRNMSPAVLKVKNIFPSINQAAIFTSSKPDQISTWHHEKKHGLFTYYFLKGLTGAADTNHDSDITSTEMGSYLTQNVPMQARKMNGQIQTPTLTQQKELLITTLTSKSATLDNNTD